MCRLLEISVHGYAAMKYPEQQNLDQIDRLCLLHPIIYVLQFKITLEK